MTNNPQNNDSQLADLGENGKPVTSRAGDAKSAAAIGTTMIQNNRIRSERMLMVQGNYDGNAPNSIGTLKLAGRNGESNINWRMTKGEVMNATVPFDDLVYQVPVCVDGELDTGEPNVDLELKVGFFKAFHKMLFGWNGNAHGCQLRNLQMILHGVGTRVWAHEIDWRPETILAANVYVEDGMRMDFSFGSFVMFTSRIGAGELWRKIEDKIPGWSEDAVWNAIQLWSGEQTISTSSEWRMRWQQKFKNGDIYVTQTQSKVIDLQTMFVQEMDGRISMLTVLAGGPGGKEQQFLFKKIGMFESWEQCVCWFPYDIGSDGTYHSVKGIGTEVFPYAKLDDKIKNSLADLVTTSTRPMFQPTTGNAAQSFQMIKLGGYNILPPNIQAVAGINISGNIQPALEVSNAFASAYGKNTGSYNRDISAPTVEETAKAALIRARERSKLNQGAYNRFYCSLDQEYRETWRRATNPDYRKHHPGGEAAVRFQKECEELCLKYGKPKDTLQKVTDIKATRDIGLGSPGIRMEIAAAMMDPNYIDRLQPLGQNAVLRSVTSAWTSYHSCDAFVPPMTMKDIPTEDDWKATMENDVLATGGDALVTDQQDHVIHLTRHIASMQEDALAAQQGAPIREVAAALESKSMHAHEHLAKITGNPTKKRQATQFNEQLRVLDGMIDHLNQNIQEQDQAQKAENPGPQSPEMVKVLADAERKKMKDGASLELKAENQQAKQALAVQNQAFQQQLAAEKTSAEVQRDNVKTAATIIQDTAKTKAKTAPVEE